MCLLLINRMYYLLIKLYNDVLIKLVYDMRSTCLMILGYCEQKLVDVSKFHNKRKKSTFGQKSSWVITYTKQQHNTI
jgi:hypothetical protein